MARTSRDGHVQERRVVEFRLVGEDVRVGVRCDGEVPLATNSPIRAHGIPPRWRSEMRRWRRSCGDHSGLPPPTRLRNRRPQRVGSRVGEEAGFGIVILARPERRLRGTCGGRRGEIPGVLLRHRRAAWRCSQRMLT